MDSERTYTYGYSNDPYSQEDETPTYDNGGILIWGRIKSEDNAPIAGALVQLLRIVHKGRFPQLISVAHTNTDRKGFYQFEIDEQDAHCDYRVLASKPAQGRGRVIKSRGCCRY